MDLLGCCGYIGDYITNNNKRKIKKNNKIILISKNYQEVFNGRGTGAKK